MPDEMGGRLYFSSGGVLVRSTLRDSRVAQGDLRAASTARAAMLLLNEVHLEMRSAIEGTDMAVNRLDLRNQTQKTDEVAASLMSLLERSSASVEIGQIDRTIGERLATVRMLLATDCGVRRIVERSVHADRRSRRVGPKHSAECTIQ